MTRDEAREAGMLVEAAAQVEHMRRALAAGMAAQPVDTLRVELWTLDDDGDAQQRLTTGAVVTPAMAAALASQFEALIAARLAELGVRDDPPDLPEATDDDADATPYVITE